MTASIGPSGSLDAPTVGSGGHPSVQHRSSAAVQAHYWKPLPFLNTARQDACSCVLDLTPTTRAVVVVGGRNAEKPSLSSVELLEWNVQRRWWTLPSLNMPRCGSSMVAFGRQLYVVGGINEESRPQASMETFQVMSNSNEWTLLESTMATARMYPAAVAFGGDLESEAAGEYIMVMGGRDQTWQELDSCELYNADTKLWSPLPNMNAKRFGCAAVYLETLHAVLAVGGYDGSEWNTSCELYDIAKQTWTEWPSMPKAVQFCAATILKGGDEGDDEYVVVRGKPVEGEQAGILQCYNVSTQEWAVMPPVSDTMGAALASIESTRLLVLGGAAMGDELEATTACRFWMANLPKLFGQTLESTDSVIQDPFGMDQSERSQRSPVPKPPKMYHRQGSSNMGGSTEQEESTVHPFLFPPISSSSSVASTASMSHSGARRKVEQEEMLDNYGAQVVYTGFLAQESGRPHGKGKMVWTLTGDIYEGRFEHGARQGKGHMRYRNGDAFVGNFLEDQREGAGRYQYRDGRVYQGSYVDDMAEDPQGIMQWKDGTKYVGQFSKAKRTGKGKITFKSNVEYEGDFVNGKYHGVGVCRFSDGSVYSGQWSRGMAHGQGKLVDAGGNVVHDGKWVNDSPAV